jgi:type I site-specific restriction endonuclease
MAKSLETIKQDLATLEESTFKMALELRQLYRKYLDLLKDSVQKQLVLAGYQICTQTYPEAFLSLSVNQRQNLQKRLRESAKQVAQELLLLINPVANLEQNALRSAPVSSPQPLSFQRDIITNIAEQQTVESTLTPTENEALNTYNPDYATAENIPNNPSQLVEWYQELERNIYRLLELLSKQANHILHENQILPHKIPTQLLDMAIQANEAQDAVSGPPNILNLLVEMQNSEQSEDANVSKITAIRLKLSEIEFADPLLSSQRNQIHNLLPKLNTLRKQYQYKQQELSIVEAELAWRSSWYED